VLGFLPELNLSSIRHRFLELILCISMQKHDASGSSGSDGAAYVYVTSEEGLINAVEELGRFQEVAFDTEGVELGRSGSLTVAGFLGIGATSVAYIVDVQELGGRAFSRSLPSLCALLEDPTVTKVTFDCRKDSEALFCSVSL
jgi:hypothetical protein